jgi:tetrapyrrole methylase family protein / MazG family protein
VPRLRPHITVVGLGPAGSDLLGAKAAELLAGPTPVILRTARHPAAAELPGARTFDALYESSDTFEKVYAAIVEELVAAATAGPVVYGVPGSPSVAERTVELLRADERVDVTVVPALSFLDLAWAALGIDPLAQGVRLVDAADFERAAAGEGGPFLVAQAWSRHLLSDVKLSVGDPVADGPARPVLLHHLGLEDELVLPVDWWELDRTIEPDHLTSVYIPASGGRTTAAVEVARLEALMDTLREHCPWDQAQTHASLMPHLVEESYEVLDVLAALGDGGGSEADYAHLEEELGDLLFQIVFHARLAHEEDHFDLAGVVRGVHDKLVHRHPHVFGDVEATGADQVVANWEEIKRSEKGRRSVTEGIPVGLPALMLTAKLARKARSVGLEPPGADEVDPAVRALGRLAEAAAQADPHPDDPLSSDAPGLEDAVGECLYVVANLAQRLGIDAEHALRERALRLRDDIVAAEGVPKPCRASR